MNHQPRSELVGKHKKKMQEYEDPEEPQEQWQQIVTTACQDSTESNSVLPLPVASCSDQGQDESASAAGGASGASSKEKGTVEAAEGGGGDGEGELPPRRFWWGDCQPHVVLLREALLSSAPDIAVLGPLHGCFSFYLTHLHNEVLSSTYARTMTLGANVTRLESGFMWIGGWRPTSALVLIYSLTGIDIEDALQAVRAGHVVSTSSLLSQRQLAVMHSLQKHTQNAEMRITKKLTLLQMLIGDQDMLEAVLLDAASPVANDSSRFHQVAERRMSRFRRLLIQAEDLRLHTLRDLLSLLTPIQAARCGVAVFEMCSALRIMGSTSLPILPALTRASPVALPALPAPSAPSAREGKTLVACCGERVIPDVSASDGILNNYDVPNSLSDEPRDNNILNSFDPSSFSNIQDEPLVSDTAPNDNILNSSHVILSQSDDPPSSDPSSPSSSRNESPVSGIAPSISVLKSSDVALSGSDKPLISDASSSSNTLNVSDDTQILVPSCSTSSSSSQLLAQDYFRDFDGEERSGLLTASLPLVKLDDDTDGTVPPRDEQLPKLGKSPEGIISNRLLLLSPSSSDVIIQISSLESAQLGVYFENRPQLPLVSAEVEESQSGLSELGNKGEYCHLQPEALVSKLSGHRPSRMSAQCECDPQQSQSNEGS